MLSCKEVTHLVSESLDRKLPLWQRLMVRLHLLMCKFCSRFQRQMFFLRDAVRQHSGTDDLEETSFPGLSPEARERIKQTLTRGPR